MLCVIKDNKYFILLKVFLKHFNCLFREFERNLEFFRFEVTCTQRKSHGIPKQFSVLKYVLEHC